MSRGLSALQGAGTEIPESRSSVFEVYRKRAAKRIAVLLAAENLAFVFSVALVVTAAKFLGIEVSVLAIATVAGLFALIVVGLARSGQYELQLGAVKPYTYLKRYCALAFLVYLTLCVLLLGTAQASLLFVWIVLPLVADGARWAVVKCSPASAVLNSRLLVIGAAGSVAAAHDMLQANGVSGRGTTELIRLAADDLAPAGDDPALWRALLTHHGADQIIVAVQGHADEHRLLQSLGKADVPATKFVALPSLGTSTDDQNVLRLKFVGHTFKMLIDLLVTISLIVLGAPVMLLIMVLIKLDGGPAFFRHERVGLRGRMFHCLKFRTMVLNGDEVLRSLLETDPVARAEWAESRKLRNDPRVTRIGKFLRATSLDELPQLYNVFHGEMSLVGPRPIVLAELPRYGDGVGHYLASTPGLTGLWQVSGRSNTSYEDRVQLDIEYVQQWSFWQDILIILKTLPAVILKRGAV